MFLGSNHFYSECFNRIRGDSANRGCDTESFMVKVIIDFKASRMDYARESYKYHLIIPSPFSGHSIVLL